MFSLQIESGGKFEKIELVYKEDEDVYMALLPSYANGDNVKIITDYTLLCEGKTYRNYDDIKDFDADRIYTFQHKNTDFTFDVLFVKSANIATVYVTMDDEATQALSRKKEGKAKISIYTPDGRLDYVNNNTARLEGRGNSTWGRPKNPFNMKLGKNESLLGMEENDKWVLLANYFDTTNLRNAIVYSFANKTELRAVTPDYQYVDLYINGSYNGLYMLTQKMEKNLYQSLPENSYVLETYVDNLRIGADEPYFQTYTGWVYTVNYPKNCTGRQANEIGELFNKFEKSLMDGTDEWKELVDIDSFARRCLLDEFFLNVDMDRLSCFYYYDSEKGKFFAGPIWDYDLTMLSSNWRFLMHRTDTVNGFNDANLYSLLYNNQDFMDRMREIYVSEFYGVAQSVIENELVDIPKTIHDSDYMNGLRWNRNSARGKSNNALTDMEGFNFINKFMNERSEYLYNLFSDMENFHRITIWILDRDYYAVFYVKDGERFSEFNPHFTYDNKVMDYLVDDATGRVFDFDTPIYRDYSLVTVYEKKAEAEQPATEEAENTTEETEVSAPASEEIGFWDHYSPEVIQAVALLGVLSLGVLILLIKDYIKNCRGKR